MSQLTCCKCKRFFSRTHIYIYCKTDNNALLSDSRSASSPAFFSGLWLRGSASFFLAILWMDFRSKKTTVPGICVRLPVTVETLALSFLSPLVPHESDGLVHPTLRSAPDIAFALSNLRVLALLSSTVNFEQVARLESRLGLIAQIDQRLNTLDALMIDFEAAL